MPSEPKPLNGRFGILIDDVEPDDLRDAGFRTEARRLWAEAGGLLAVRGPALAELPPADLVSWSGVFGTVEREEMSGRDDFVVSGHPILRIGNTTHADGRPRASFAEVPALRSDDDVRYDPETRRPVWHTDSTFREHPPLGSLLHCRIAPPWGGDTLFADTAAAYAALDEQTRARLDGLEAVCSLAHHDKKISLYSPGYTVLTPEQRAANPARRVPIVLRHPEHGRPALYGMNSSTCAVVDKGAAVSTEQLDRFDLEGEEDDSVAVLRDLLPFATGPAFAVRWRWQPGDTVVWDNRCTMHAATGFDHRSHEREMWRLTLVGDPGNGQSHHS